MYQHGARRWTVVAMVFLLLGNSAPIFGGPGHQHHGSSQHNPAALEAQAKATADEQTPWGADYFPNAVLTTHEGKSVRFFDDLLKDKVVVINFVYTSCTDSCPLETAAMANMQKLLGDRVGKDVFIYSITIDPKRDTPAVLKEYAKKFGAGPGWTFLTGKEADIILIRKKLGLYIDTLQNDDERIDHSLSLIMGNQRTGQWMKRSPFESPYFLAEQVGSWLHNWKFAVANEKSYADAPKLRAMEKGEIVFRGRCSTCHTIGGGDVSEPIERRFGPDLFAVTKKRDRAWLARWIANPEKMLAEKDPIAVELYNQYNRLPMPNFFLSESDVNAVIDYLDAETRRLEKMQPTASTK